MDKKTTPLDLQSFKLAVDNSTDHITLTDPDGIILYANKSVERMSGFPLKDVVGQKAGSSKLWGGLMSSEFYKNLWHTIKDQRKPFTGEFKNKRKDGSVFFTAANIFPVIDDDGKVKLFVEVHRDITLAKEFEKSKTEFLSLAVHQLQTPLTIVKWCLEVLRQTSLTEQQNAFVVNADEANERMIRLVNELVDATKIELGTLSVNLVASDPQKIFTKVKDEFNDLASQKHIKIKEKYGVLPQINADTSILSAIFRALLSNAFKYTPENGKVSINLSFDKDKQEIILKIEDSGFGIAPSDRDKIFSKMFRSDKARLNDPQGIGIGLFIIKNLVEASGGQVWYESPSTIGTKSNPGTTFFVTLPRDGMKAIEKNMWPRD